MPYCMNCGQELPENAEFCGKCGMKVNLRLVSKCPKCGAEMKKEIYTELYHPFAFNPLGHALGSVKYKERYVCTVCNYKKELG